MQPAGRRPPAYQASGFFCLRTHLLPFDELVRWGAGFSRPVSGAGDHPHGPLQPGDIAARNHLRELVRRPEVREAIFVASPALDEVVDIWLSDPASDRGRRAERSLVKYVSRMAGRPTPFGLFAAVACGELAETTNLRVSPADRCLRHTRLDNEYLFALAQLVARNPEVRSHALYVPNDSLDFTAGRGRYAEVRVTEDSHTFHLVGLEESPELRETLSRAIGGATRADLAGTLVDGETTKEEAERYVDELIEGQVLIPDIGVQVTGPEPASALADRLNGIPAATQVAEGIRSATEAIAQLDSAGLGNTPARYREIASRLEALPAKVALPRLFQVDLVRPEAGTLGQTLLREIVRGVDLLHRITPLDPEDILNKFRAAFVDRYEGREVPLLEALDEEVGLGTLLWPAEDPSPLLKGLPLTRSEEERVRWDERGRHLAFRLGQAVSRGSDELVLNAEDLQALSEPAQSPLPDAFAAMVTVAAASEEAVARGDFEILLHHVDGPSGARLLGRFCHADPALAARTTEHLRAEEAHDPDAIYAELVHLSEGRLGNILLRPVFRDYEITYLGRSGLPDARTIPASDLQVSVLDGRIVLRSARLGRRIIPRLSSAHNYRRGLAPYRFLCLLQAQGKAGALSWRWGPGAEAAPFLPRVRFGRIVLALARWRVEEREIRALSRAPEGERFQAFAAWRATRRLPRWVALADSDNRLPVDLDNPLAVDCLLHEIGDREEALLEELWPETGRLIARGPEGAYRHELIVPFVRTPEPNRAHRAVPPAHAEAGRITRRFPPGSEWLYLKLYTSHGVADELLTGIVAPLSQQALGDGSADRWFFLRYNDPEFHLRWRIHGEPPALFERMWPEIKSAIDPLVEDGTIWRVQLDTYEREVERYGGPDAIAATENIFWADSDAVAGIVELLEPGDAGLDERWRLGLRGADQLWDDLGLTLEEKLTAAEAGGKHYGSVPEPSAALRHKLTARYRELRKGAEELLERALDQHSPLAPGFELLSARSVRIAEPVAQLRELDRAGRLLTPWVEIAGSLVHMHLNRLCRGDPNAHEVVIYDFLRRIYQSRLARKDGGS
jgi:thiopeptide-type bacteriocin biosynthesis protein